MKKSLLALAALLLLLGISPVAAENSSGSLAPFVRYDKATDTLETSIATFRSTSGQELDLISAVHVATPSYYGQLNKEFATYDTVLYELILPESVAGQRLPSQLEGGGAVSGIQGMIANTLGLTTQLSGIDYSARNFVHADLTQEGLAQKMAQRQENMMAYMMKVLSSSQSIDESQLGVTDQELAQLDLVAIMNGKPSARDRKARSTCFPT